MAPKRPVKEGAIVTPPSSRQIFALVASVAERPVDEIEPSMHFLADLEIDSLKAIELLCEIEDHFHIELDEAEVMPITKVGELITVVETAIGAARIGSNSPTHHP